MLPCQCLCRCRCRCRCQCPNQFRIPYSHPPVVERTLAAMKNQKARARNVMTITNIRKIRLLAVAFSAVNFHISVSKFHAIRKLQPLIFVLFLVVAVLIKHLLLKTTTAKIRFFLPKNWNRYTAKDSPTNYSS